MKNLRKKSVAVTIMIIMILAGILGGGYFSLARAQDRAEQTFYSGESSLQTLLDQRMEAAQNLIYIGKQYNSQQESESRHVEVDTVSAAVETLYQSQTPSEKYDASTHLKDAVTDLYISLQGTDLKDSHGQTADEIYEAFQNQSELSLAETYNKAASDFNVQLQQFPANILNMLYRFQEADLYQ